MSARPTRSRLTRWTANLLLLGVSCAIGLAVAELAVRHVIPQSVLLWQPGPFVQDGEGFFRLRPGHRGSVTNRTEYDHPVRINAAGLRGEELGAKPEDVCRVLAVGDSFTFGLGVEETEVFHRVAAERLREEGLAVEVANGGIPAIGVPQEVRWLERHGLATDPDLVLLTIFVGNDLRDAVSDYDHWTVIDGQLAPPGARKGLKDWLYEHLHLFVLLKTAVPSGLQNRLRARLGMGEPWSLRYAREVFGIYHRDPPPRVHEGLERTGQALDRLVTLAETHRFRLAASLIPDVVQVDPARWQASLTQLGLAADDVDPRQPNHLLRAALERRGIPVLDHADAFQAGLERGDVLYFPTDRHWTREGHRTAGEELAEFLRPEMEACR